LYFVKSKGFGFTKFQANQLKNTVIGISVDEVLPAVSVAIALIL
jgi:hypothetical protein